MSDNPRGRPPISVSARRRRRIVELREQALTQEEIAQRVGVSVASVSYNLRRARQEAKENSATN